MGFFPYAKAAEPVSFKPATPTPVTSLTLVMLGLGQTATFTPTTDSKVLVLVTSYATTNTTITSMTIGGRYGTGTAPANGAAVTGTRFGSDTDISFEAAVQGQDDAFTIAEVLSLTGGTKYWFDLAVATSNASDAAVVRHISISLIQET